MHYPVVRTSLLALAFSTRSASSTSPSTMRRLKFSAFTSAIGRARLAGREVTESDLIGIAGKLVPLSCTMKDQISAIRGWAFERAIRVSRIRTDIEALLHTIEDHGIGTRVHNQMTVRRDHEGPQWQASVTPRLGLGNHCAMILPLLKSHRDRTGRIGNACVLPGRPVSMIATQPPPSRERSRSGPGCPAGADLFSGSCVPTADADVPRLAGYRKAHQMANRLLDEDRTEAMRRLDVDGSAALDGQPPTGNFRLCLMREELTRWQQNHVG